MSSQGALPDGPKDFGLIETFLWTREGGYFLRAGHRARLVNSARALGFAFAQKDFDEVLARADEIAWFALHPAETESVRSVYKGEYPPDITPTHAVIRKLDPAAQMRSREFGKVVAGEFISLGA